MGLHIDIIDTEELFGAFNRQLFSRVNIDTTGVVALARVALGVLVGHHAAGGGHNGGRGVVFGGDEEDVRALALLLGGDSRGYLGVLPVYDFVL